MAFNELQVALSNHCLNRANDRVKKLFQKSGEPIGEVWLRDRAREAVNYGWGKEITTDGFSIHLDIEKNTVTFVFKEIKGGVLLKTIY